MPAIVSNVTVPLLGLSDTAISGHLGSADYIAAISVGSMMIVLSFGVLNFLRMGTTGMTAVAYGEKNAQKIREVFSSSLVIALLLGCLLIAFQKPLSGILLYIVGPDAAVRELSLAYFRICIAGMPALLGTMVVSGWFIGMQSTFWPMVIAVGMNVLNILMSFLLVFPLNVGFEGVAYGTLTANYAGLVFSLLLARRLAPEGGLWSGRNRIFRGELLRRFFSVNSNIFLRSLCVMSVTLSVTAYGARLGALTLASNAVIVQFFIFFSYFMDGYAFTGEALCGKYYGAGDAEGLKKTVRYLLWWSAGIAAAFFLVYTVGWETVTSLLTDNVDVRNMVADYHLWIMLIPPFAVLAFIYDGFFIGITSTRPMLVATSIAVGVFFAVTLPAVNGLIEFNNDVLWGAFLGYLLVRGAILAGIWWRREKSGVFIVREG